MPKQAFLAQMNVVIWVTGVVAQNALKLRHLPFKQISGETIEHVVGQCRCRNSKFSLGVIPPDPHSKGRRGDME